jgi:radical SAM/Cys-rich protein
VLCSWQQLSGVSGRLTEQDHRIMTAASTLLRQASPLADPARQVEILEAGGPEPLATFPATLALHQLPPLRAHGIDILQINVGKICNQTCHHCHVDAGPDRREAMSRETADHCLRVLSECDIATLDITGGAPEMNPQFRHMVVEARRAERRVIDRCNLTILLAPRYEDLPEFLAEHHVEIIASLPCYIEENCDRQRGDGVFRKSVDALRRLNALGYGVRDDLRLSLVFNPQGASLPPDERSLEAAYRRELQERYGISFTRLFAITNMPIARFLDDLLQSGRYEPYMRSLVDAFQPTTIDGVMCRTMLSVDWLGNLFDCDFNQMLALPVRGAVPKHLRDVHRSTLSQLAARRIATGRHCFGCTAGAGSSCQGSLVS